MKCFLPIENTSYIAASFIYQMRTELIENNVISILQQIVTIYTKTGMNREYFKRKRKFSNLERASSFDIIPRFDYCCSVS